MPPLAALVVVAPDFVPVVLGDQWDAAVPVIQILAWVGIVQALQSLSVDVLMARDRARTIFRFSLVLVTCHLVAFVVGLNWGVVGVAVAFAISTTLVEPLPDASSRRARWACRRWCSCAAISGVFQAAAGMCLVVLARARRARRRGRRTQALRLVVCTGVGVVVYAGALRVARAGAGARGPRPARAPRRGSAAGGGPRRRRRVLSGNIALQRIAPDSRFASLPG